jgi:hypothetical protein
MSKEGKLFETNKRCLTFGRWCLMMSEKEDRKARSMSQVGQPDEEQYSKVISVPPCSPQQHGQASSTLLLSAWQREVCRNKMMVNTLLDLETAFLRCIGGVEWKLYVLHLSGPTMSSVSIVSDYGMDDQGSIPDRSKGFFLSPLRPDWLSSSPSLLSNGYRGSFPLG